MDSLVLTARLLLDTSEYTSGLNTATSTASSFGSKVAGVLGSALKAGAVALGATTTAVVAFGKSAVSAGAEFDTAMSQVGATMGYSAEEINTVGSEANTTMATLRQFAQTMGSETAFSATQASEALNYMALAGYDANQSMEMLPKVLNLASAGSMDLADASDMVTDAQTALGLSSDETSQLVDKMAMTASKSNTSVSQMGEAILTVGGTAKMMAGGTTELSTALGILADNGTKGSEAGTKLRNILLSLGAPTDTAQEALDALGVSAYDADGNMKPLQQTFGELNDAMSDMTTAEKTDIINTIFNKTDLKDVNALLDTNASRWEELSGYIDDSAGSAEEMANVQLDNLSGDVTLFKSALEGAQIAVSDQLTPTLREFVQLGTEGLSQVTSAFNEGGLAGAMAYFGQWLSEGLNMILDKVPDLIKAGAQLLEALISGIADNLPSVLTSAGEVVTQLVTGIVDGLPKLMQQGGKIIQSLITTIHDNISQIMDAGFQMISQLGQGIANGLPELIPQVVEIIMQIVTSIVSHLPEILTAGIQIITSLTEGLISSIPQLIEAIPQIIEGLVTGIVNNLPMLLECAIEMMIYLSEALVEAIPTLLACIPTIIEGIINAFKAIDWSEIGTNIINGIVEGFTHAYDVLSKTVTEVVDHIKKWFCDLFGIHSPSTVFAEYGTYLIEGLISTFQDLPNRMWTVVTEAYNKLVTWITNMISTIKTGATNMLNGFINIIQALPGRLFSILSNAFTNLVTWAGNMIDKFKTTATESLNGFITNLSNLASNLKDKLDEAFDKVKAWYKDMVDKFKTTATEALNGFITNLSSLANDLKGKLDDAFDKVKGWYDDMIKKAGDTASDFIKTLVDGFANIGSEMKTIGSNIVNGIKDGISEGWSELTDFVEGLAKGLLTSAKKALGIHSPSKEFMAIGKMCVAGFEVGMEDFANPSTYVSAINDMMNEVSNPSYGFTSAGNGYGYASGGINQTININQQISTPDELARAIRLESKYGLMRGVAIG